MNLYIDIETIPTQRDDIRESIAAGIKPPANYSKPETIEKWEKESKPEAVESAIHATGLDGTFGEIICIGWALDDECPSCVGRFPNEPEGELLNKFFTSLDENIRLLDPNGYQRHPTWIGHFITGFDLRFIWQRCVINSIKPIVKIPYDAKPWGDQVFDTKVEWTGMNKYTGNGSLDAISKALGYEGKGDMDGSKVWSYIQEGKLKEVMDYCKDDVEKTRLLHKRMTFN